VEPGKGWIFTANIVELGIEVREILPHFDTRLEDPYFGQLACAVINDFGMCRFQSKCGIPSPAIFIIEAPTARSRMAEGGHDSSRMGTTNDPLFRWNQVQESEFHGEAVVGPALQFHDGGKVLGACHCVEQADRRIPARNEPVRVLQPEPETWRR